MASCQPDHTSEATTANGSRISDTDLFLTDPDIHERDEFYLSRGVLNTHGLERNYPRLASPPEASLNKINCDFPVRIKSDQDVGMDLQELDPMYCGEMSHASSSLLPQRSNEESADSCLGAGSNDETLNSDSDQEMGINAEEIIAAIAEDLQNSVREFSNKADVQAINNAIHYYPNPSMRVRTEPMRNQRIRYLSEEKRYLENSKEHPMSIELPVLADCLKETYQSFWLVLTLITTSNNPEGRPLVHPYAMTYHGENAEQIESSSFRIPLTERDIRHRQKTLRSLSIIKTKHETYTYELIPFGSLIIGDQIEYYTINQGDGLGNMSKAKRFDQLYQTINCRIACQLMIKQRDQWYPTNLSCESRLITNTQ